MTIGEPDALLAAALDKTAFLPDGEELEDEDVLGRTLGDGLVERLVKLEVETGTPVVVDPCDKLDGLAV